MPLRWMTGAADDREVDVPESCGHAPTNVGSMYGQDGCGVRGQTSVLRLKRIVNTRGTADEASLTKGR